MLNQEIILISDPRILQIPIRENNDSLTDLREVSDLKLDHRKQKDSDSYFMLRQDVVLKLLEVQRILPKDIKLLIIEGFRPLLVQKIYFDNYSKKLMTLHPDWDSRKIREEASKFVAPPEIIPPHCTGGAADLTLIDASGNELDLGTKVNADPELCHEACFTGAENISQKAKESRELLIEAMLRYNFVNYPTEWWHWSYGDRYWAYMKNEPFAIYGSI